MSRPKETVFRAASVRTWMASILFCTASAALSAGCSSSAVTDDPYESCEAGDLCTAGLDCIETTLPISSGFSGNLCTSGCNADSDCYQVSDNSAVCVNSQCYLTCPTGSESCPYSQGCFTFDSNAGSISLCTP
jgi:hypothetical protein